MNLSTDARNRAFWAVDRLKGSPVRRSLRDVEAILAAPRSAPVQAFLDRRLRRLLVHAAATVPHLAGCDPDRLGSFPVVTKAVMRDGGEDFLSRPYAGTRLSETATSGSTGAPFQVLRDDVKVRRNVVDALALARRAGYDVGMPMFYLRREHPTARLRAWAENLVDVDVGDLREGAAPREVARIRGTRGPVAIMGYASGLEALCREIESRGRPLEHVACVISLAESPSEYLYRASPRCFGRELAARYSDVELGLLAQQRPGERPYLINVASHHVEILALVGDGPAAPGELGRIVVTDLFNRAMPFVRYDTGDLGRFAVLPDGTPDTTVLDEITGRINDQIYDTADRLVSVLGIVRDWGAYRGIEEWQFVQTGSGAYLFKQHASVDPERDRALAEEFRSYLGRDARIEMRYVDGIPLLRSGKRRAFANEWDRSGGRAPGRDTPVGGTPVPG
jgi:phenylacetate-CoA ligase